MSKRLLIFGPPGAGKGTHAKRLAGDLGVPHLASGELFREAVRRRTPSGLRAEAFIGRGELVPDGIVISMIEERLTASEAREGYLLDGFPRTVPQASALVSLVGRLRARVDGVLWLEAPEEVLIGRLAGRATCSGCQAVFHRASRPPKKEGLCDACGGVLIERPDDTEAVVRRRLSEYRCKTAPVLDFFRSTGWPLWSVDSLGDVDAVYRQICRAVRA